MSTLNTAGGMALAFTQEDFLVFSISSSLCILLLTEFLQQLDFMTSLSVSPPLMYCDKKLLFIIKHSRNIENTYF